MEKRFAVEAAEVQIVSSLKEFQDRASVSRGDKPIVHKSARELFPDAPAPKTVSEARSEETK